MNKKINDLPLDLKTIDANILVKKLEEDMKKREMLGEEFDSETEFETEHEEGLPFVSMKMQNTQKTLHEKMLNKYTPAKKRNQLLRQR